MKLNNLKLCLLIMVLGTGKIQAQEATSVTLREAVQLALENSNKSKISMDKVTTAKNELQVTKNLRYPDAKIAGQYQYLPSAKINLHQPPAAEGETPSTLPNVGQLFLGQFTVGMPVFTGFKLKNAIAASENSYQAASFNAANDQEQIALETINAYINLYKAKESIGLIRENLKTADQRVADFSEMEKNGLLARNDLLKAQLQSSNIEVTLEEALKAQRILNYQLVVMLQLPEGTQISTEENEFRAIKEEVSAQDSISRNDLLALYYQSLAAENQLKIAQSRYYPTLSVVGGYIALDIHNALTVTNAMNIGVAFSYNLADIFKTKSDIRVAQSKASEVQHTYDLVSDQINVQVENAEQEYKLALKKYQVYIKSQEQAEENYRIVKDKYNNGLQDTNDLLEADVEQLQAKINLAFSKADISQKYYEMLTAKGTLTDNITTN
jgi:outer membrane protein TolC